MEFTMVPGARRAGAGRSCGGGSTWQPLGQDEDEDEVGGPTGGRRSAKSERCQPRRPGTQNLLLGSGSGAVGLYVPS